MKAVIAAGGSGSRMGELSRVTNKHLLPLGEYPLIYHPIQKLVGAGITKILIVSGHEKTGDFIELLGSGRRLGCDLTYRVQEKPSGIADALSLAEDFCAGEECVMLLGDNVFEDDLGGMLATTRRGWAWTFLKEVDNPGRYGVACFSKGNLHEIVEKPEVSPSNLAVTGIYVYPPDVFKFIKTLKMSDRGEYEITDVNNFYIRQSRMGWSKLSGYWTDAGTIESWQLANQLVKNYDK